MSGTCFIVGAAPDGADINFSPQDHDLIIAADGGFVHLERLGIIPAVIIGDFDSLGFIPAQALVLPFAKEKDETDMMLAIRYGLDKGYQTFEIYGGIGGRIDHMIANVQALTFLASHGACGRLVGHNTCATVICSGSIEFEAEKHGVISIFALDKEVQGVTVCGLQYPLTEATLTNTFPLGVSNAFIGQASVVSVREGALLIIWWWD